MVRDVGCAPRTVAWYLHPSQASSAGHEVSVFRVNHKDFVVNHLRSNPYTYVIRASVASNREWNPQKTQICDLQSAFLWPLRRAFSDFDLNLGWRLGQVPAGTG